MRFVGHERVGERGVGGRDEFPARGFGVGAGVGGRCGEDVGPELVPVGAGDFFHGLPPAFANIEGATVGARREADGNTAFADGTQAQLAVFAEITVGERERVDRLERGAAGA